MFRNYLKIAWRNIWKNKVYSAINIIGLAIGLAACIVIMLFVFYEKSFDAAHKQNIYRLMEVQKFEGMVAPQNVALSMYPMGPTLVKEFPEIKNFVRSNYVEKYDFTYKEKTIFMPRVNRVDSTFFDIFDYKVLRGDRATVLDKPNSLVLSEKSAKNLFGNEDPIGKTVIIYSRDTLSLQVTGIMEDVPLNSHLQFDGLISFSTIARPQMMENWGGNWLVTYLVLDPRADIAALEKKFPDYLKRHMTNGGWKFYELFLQKLTDVHSGSTDITHDYQNFRKFDKSYTKVFTIIALIVLLIACINFMNLSTARSAERAREVGIRKSVGAQRFQLVSQFIGESILLVLVALILAIGIVYASLPYVRNLSQRDLQLPLFTDPMLLLSIIGGAVTVGILSGLYPAGYLSSFQPVKVLKGFAAAGKYKSSFRNFLVVLQFSGAVFLIIATVLAIKQLRFMLSKDPGFDREQVLTIPFANGADRKYQLLKEELLKNTLVKGVTATQQGLGNNLHQSGMLFRGKNQAQRELTSSRAIVDRDFLTVYKIPLVAGRNFSDNPNENGRTMIVNETLAKELLKDQKNADLQSLIGTQFGFNGMDTLPTIVGVAKDFNFNSLHHNIETLYLFNQKDWGFAEMSVKIDARRAEQAIAYVQNVWNKNVPELPMDFTFLDDHFADLYRADSQVSEFVGILAGLAIIISCLGLFGLASFAAEKRIREVGIRKVLGASVQSIVTLLSGSFLKLVIISNIIAWPVAWYVLNNWLQDFAYRIDISWWVFAITGLVSLLIALATVSFQAIRAAVANPVKSLRTE
jgi:putative ABC transport system permease protein